MATCLIKKRFTGCGNGELISSSGCIFLPYPKWIAAKNLIVKVSELTIKLPKFAFLWGRPGFDSIDL